MLAQDTTQHPHQSSQSRNLSATGTGKTELINSLLNRPAGSRTNAFREATRRVRVVRGDHNGIPLTFIDTPGLHASASRTADNRAILRAVRAAYRWHKPDYVFYVDRWGGLWG